MGIFETLCRKYPYRGSTFHMHFRLKTLTFHVLRPSVHTNTLSIFIENASIWKRSWMWNKTKTHTCCINVDGWKRSKTNQMKTMTENIADGSVCSVRVDFNLRQNVQFNCFRTFYWGQSKTHQNRSEYAIRWQRKRILLKANLCRQCLSLLSVNFHFNSPLVVFIVTPHYISLTLFFSVYFFNLF